MGAANLENDGLTRADLDVICNTAKEKIIGNARSAIARDLPWFDTATNMTGMSALSVAAHRSPTRSKN
jgi:hypothetical protein